MFGEVLSEPDKLVDCAVLSEVEIGKVAELVGGDELVEWVCIMVGRGEEPRRGEVLPLDCHRGEKGDLLVLSSCSAAFSLAGTDCYFAVITIIINHRKWWGGNIWEEGYYRLRGWIY